MAVSNRRFVRVPPDSTGKRVGNAFTLHLEYTSRTAPITVGDVLVGVSSNTQGNVVSVKEDTGATSGTIVLRMEQDYFDSSYTDGEALNIDGSQVAIANGTGTPIFYAQNVIVGANNEDHGQFIDREGAAYIRFAEGSPKLDAVSDLQVSNGKSLAHYSHVGEEDRSFYLITGSGGSKTYDIQDSNVVLAVDANSGSYTKYRTNIWHKYEPGEPMALQTSLVCEDTGKSGLVRRWGYFDDEDGLFFEQSGSEFYVVQRDSIGGTVTETKVSQSAWNTDKLDGSETHNNISRIGLDVTKANVYFIDFQWFGAGRVRFGVIEKGRRVIAHSIENANTITRAYMKRASLPVSLEQINYEATSGGSELRHIASTVRGTSEYNPEFVDRELNLTNLGYTGSFDGYTPLFSARSAITGANGQDNRNYSIPQLVTVFSYDHDIEFHAHIGAVLTGASWFTSSENPSAEVDISATDVDMSVGEHIHTEFIKAGEPITFSVEHSFGNPERWIKRFADINAEPEAITISAKLLPTATANTGSQATGSLGVTVHYNTYVD